MTTDEPEAPGNLLEEMLAKLRHELTSRLAAAAGEIVRQVLDNLALRLRRPDPDEDPEAP